MRFETIQLHGGYDANAHQRSRAVPTYNTTSYLLGDSDRGAGLFGLTQFGDIYTRLMNPTHDVFEKRVAALEGGVAALATASGQAAQFLTIATICVAGDNVVTSPFLYGGSFNQFKITLPRFGIDMRFTENTEVESYEKLIDDKTKAIYVETLSNPNAVVPDFTSLSALAKKHGIPLIVDNTFGCCGAVCKPIEHGADIVVASATKWIGGHGTTIGGVVVDAGTFPWNNGKFPEFTGPNPNYHGLKLWDAFGPEGVLAPANVAFAMKIRLEMMRDIGACANPGGVSSLIVGLETLSLRVERHCSNALALARWLKDHESVSYVLYSGLEDHPHHEQAKVYFSKDHFGAVLSFGIKGGLKSGKAFIDNVKLCSHLANVGDARTLVIHPASTTHQQLTADDQKSAGVLPDLVRVSVGIEHIEDIKEDFVQALKIATA